MNHDCIACVVSSRTSSGDCWRSGHSGGANQRNQKRMCATSRTLPKADFSAESRDSAPLSKILVYTIGNVILNGLNVFWFSKMIASVRKRSASPAKGATKEVKSQ